ncbi:polyphosphate polymerase domain-containing protein [Actinokineospora diospyrosa]|uniref:VTC domain-containing protein n=1 Tax=Actinokineospora diospyrosa TaxID=103728 RepID=A0ABT1IBI2_9PSEU|nr:polyphosphate polymerase domain-containing protein [Actinokineospora diospyrosa]MCP2269993.1 VTC domain-containing protein [Actinokineospora diospyrosa]
MMALEPIWLDELVERAELLTRVDRKYVLSVPAAEALLSALPAGTRVLDIDGRREFGYRSTYLDTPDRQSFHTSGCSRRRRWKVRTRTYLDSGSSWLEVKTLAARGRTVKQRIAHPDDRLTGEGREFVAGIVGAEVTRHLRPVLVTGYRRRTLFLPRDGARVTVDVDLGWTSLANARELARPELVLVETKCGSTPSAVDRLLWSRGLRPERISKYGVGMVALHPDLPHLKWHRATRHHFGLRAA